jgi:predicted metal-dependent HD superfamily phosphohydrolase
MDAFQERWNNFFAWNPDEGSRYVVGNILKTLYTDPNRHYHNDEHVLFCLDRLNEVRELCDNYHQVAAAILFHDAIYNTKSEDNERMSADLFMLCLGGKYDHDTLWKIKSLIMETKHLAKPLPRNTDGMLIRDIDLSIMGFPWEIYCQTEPKIRKEYHWVPEDVFKIHRASFLEDFLKRERIFLTSCFYEKFEKQARENLARSLESLKI